MSKINLKKSTKPLPPLTDEVNVFVDEDGDLVTQNSDDETTKLGGQNLMDDHLLNHPAPTSRDTRNEAAGAATAAISAHESSHPAPTSRDTRNEAAFAKNTAFNKNFGTGADEVCPGNDSRLSDERTPAAHSHDLAVPTGEGQKDGFLWHLDKAKLDGIAPGATAAGATGDAHATSPHAPADAEQNGSIYQAEVAESTTISTRRRNQVIPVNSTATVEITIAANVHLANDEVTFQQTGLGIIKLIAGAGMTINRGKETSEQFQFIGLKFISGTACTTIGVGS